MSSVKSASEAIASVRSEKPDLVILDVDLPDNGGFQVLAEIRGICESLPIIINTGYAHFRADVRSWTADAFIIKSSLVEELMAKAAELMTGQKSTHVSIQTEDIENSELSG